MLSDLLARGFGAVLIEVAYGWPRLTTLRQLMAPSKRGAELSPFPVDKSMDNTQRQRY
jgi:hypothetical protein